MTSHLISRTLSAASTRTFHRTGTHIIRGARWSSTHAKAEPVFHPVWAGGSALVFGTLGFMALTSSGRKAEESSHGHSTNTRKDTDLEAQRTGREANLDSDHGAPNAETDSSEKESINKAVAADDPKAGGGDDTSSEEKASTQQALKADAPAQAKQAEEEGPSEKDSIVQAMNADEPNTAKAAEAKKARK